MPDNIRTTVPNTFSNQDWQKEKIRATPGTATVDEIKHKVTAEWANAVDEAQREINLAFYGAAQQAVNTRGWVRGSSSAQTVGVVPTTQIQTIKLVSNVHTEEFIHADVIITARRVGSSTGSASHHEIALLQLTGGVFVRRATELSADQSDPTDSLSWLVGANAVFPATSGTGTLAVTVTGPTSGNPIHWTVDFSVRSGPTGLPDDTIVGTT